MSTPESELLRHIYRRSVGLGAAMGNALEIGPGDDCAAVRVREGSLLLTVDQLVEGRHYAPATPLELVARKCIARSVSDIAAMGGTPLVSLATGALNDAFDRENELFDAMHRWASELGCPLVGGDIARTSGPTVLTCTALGTPHPSRGAVAREGARPGDGVYLAGRIGNSFASGRHLTFAPQIAEGRWLCDTLGADLHAMLDVSDGVGRDAARIAEASGVRIGLDASSLPMNHDTADWRAAISEGEDYTLLFTASREPGAACPATGTLITRIGTVRESHDGQPACEVLTPEGTRLDGGALGWDHGVA